MDPSSNRALHSAKAKLLFPGASQTTTTNNTTSNNSNMPPPPPYNMVVDPNAPIPIRTPYDFQDHDADHEDEDENEVPEVTINATTQVRGHGNIITVPQLDSARIAGMVICVLNGGPPSPTQMPSIFGGQQQQQQTPQQQPATQTATPPGTANEDRPSSPQTHQQHSRRILKPMPRINVTVNCGATVIGDRNIVGPGLGDIARQMQLQAHQRQQQVAAHAAAQAQSARAAQATAAAHHSIYAAHGFPTPPMSRSASGNSEGNAAAAAGVKRKAEGGGEAGGQHEGKKRDVRGL